MPKRCILGCGSQTIYDYVAVHRFPNYRKYPQRFHAWVRAIGGNLNTAEDYKYYMKKVVCDLHFSDKDRNRNNRVNALAIPTLDVADRFKCRYRDVHRFPNIYHFPARFRAWVKIAGGQLNTYGDYFKYKHKYVCGLHFSENDLDSRKRLKPYVVPTLNLPDNEQRNRYRFPNILRFPGRFKAWVTVAGGKLESYADYEYYIKKNVCAIHFAEDDFTSKNRLKPSAVPSRNLPNNAAVDSSIMSLVEHDYCSLDILTQGNFKWKIGNKKYELAPPRGFMYIKPDDKECHIDHNYVKIQPTARRVEAPEKKEQTETKSDPDENEANFAIEEERRDDDVEAVPDDDTPVAKTPEPVFSWENAQVIDEDDLEESKVPTGAPTKDDSEVSMYQDNDCVAIDTETDTGAKFINYRCNECNTNIFSGFRYTCVQCVEWDICATCEAHSVHSAHYVLRIPSCRPYKEMQAVLEIIRNHLMGENLFIPEVVDCVKEEIKEEPPEEAPEAELAPAPPPAAEPDPLAHYWGDSLDDELTFYAVDEEERTVVDTPSGTEHPAPSKRPRLGSTSSEPDSPTPSKRTRLLSTPTELECLMPSNQVFIQPAEMEDNPLESNQLETEYAPTNTNEPAASIPQTASTPAAPDSDLQILEEYLLNEDDLDDDPSEYPIEALEESLLAEDEQNIQVPPEPPMSPTKMLKEIYGEKYPLKLRCDKYTYPQLPLLQPLPSSVIANAKAIMGKTEPFVRKKAEKKVTSDVSKPLYIILKTPYTEMGMDLEETVETSITLDKATPSSVTIDARLRGVEKVQTRAKPKDVVLQVPSGTELINVETEELIVEDNTDTSDNSQPLYLTLDALQKLQGVDKVETKGSSEHVFVEIPKGVKSTDVIRSLDSKATVHLTPVSVNSVPPALRSRVAKQRRGPTILRRRRHPHDTVP